MLARVGWRVSVAWRLDVRRNEECLRKTLQTAKRMGCDVGPVCWGMKSQCGKERKERKHHNGDTSSVVLGEERRRTMMTKICSGREGLQTNGLLGRCPLYRFEFADQIVQLGLTKGSRPLAEWKFVAPP